MMTSVKKELSAKKPFIEAVVVVVIVVVTLMYVVGWLEEEEVLTAYEGSTAVTMSSYDATMHYKIKLEQYGVLVGDLQEGVLASALATDRIYDVMSDDEELRKAWMLVMTDRISRFEFETVLLDRLKSAADAAGVQLRFN